MRWHASSTNPSRCTSLQRFGNAPFSIGAVSKIEHFQRPGHRLFSRVLLGDLPNTSLSRQLSIIVQDYQNVPHAGRHLLLNRLIFIGPDGRWVLLRLVEAYFPNPYASATHTLAGCVTRSKFSSISISFRGSRTQQHRERLTQPCGMCMVQAVL